MSAPEVFRLFFLSQLEPSWRKLVWRSIHPRMMNNFSPFLPGACSIACDGFSVMLLGARGSNMPFRTQKGVLVALQFEKSDP